MTRTPWTDSQVGVLRRMRADGSLNREIASALGKSEVAIKAKIKALGLPKPEKPKNKLWPNRQNESELRIWRGMLNRCYNKNVTNYSMYGGRGIAVCDEWKNSFENFYNAMGPRPSAQHSIDRIDNNKDYTPENCRWATRTEQMANRGSTRFVTYRSERMPLTKAVRLAGSVIHREAAWIRITKCGWSTERALETPRLFVSPNARRHHKRSGIDTALASDTA